MNPSFLRVVGPALCLCGAGLAALPVQAQSVVLYGLMDQAIEHVSHVGPAGSGLTRMPSMTGSLPSRWGLRGREDLGGGVQLGFVLEQGLQPDAGGLSQGGRMFGRQALIELSGGWGWLTLGRQSTQLFHALLDADLMGPALYGSGSLDSYLPNARVDNALGYRWSGQNLTVGGTFSLGRDGVNAGPSPAGTNCGGEVAGDARACREWSAMVKYSRPTWGVAAAIDALSGGRGAFGGLTASDRQDKRVTLNGHVRIDRSLKLTAGGLRRDNDGSATVPRSDLYFVGVAKEWGTSWVTEVQGFRLRYAGAVDQATLWAARGTYRLSSRSAVYAMLGHIDNGGSLALSVSAGAAGSSPALGGSQTAVALGVRHAF